MSKNACFCSDVILASPAAPDDVILASRQSDSGMWFLPASLLFALNPGHL